jgi:hypothetical protein
MLFASIAKFLPLLRLNSLHLVIDRCSVFDNLNLTTSFQFFPVGKRKRLAKIRSLKLDSCFVVQDPISNQI